MSHITEAFFRTCKEASLPKAAYVSLYVSEQFYGGAEEGGWWGNDVKLVASQLFVDMDEAEAAIEDVEKYATMLTEEATVGFNRQCRAECDWLDARGLDADYLPEVSGSDRYFVVVEERKGSAESEGCRHYE